MLRVVSLGVLINDQRYISRGSTPYPVGYSVEVPVFLSSTKGTRAEAAKMLFPGDEAEHKVHVAEVYYTASIRQGPDGGPLFEVTRSDVPNVSHKGENPSKPWRDAFAAAERDFPDTLNNLNRPSFVNGHLRVYGIQWFGLTNANVVEQIKKLPGGSSIFSEAKSNISLEDNEEEPLSDMTKEKTTKTKGKVAAGGVVKGKKSSLASQETDGHASGKGSRSPRGNKQKQAKSTVDSNNTNKDTSDDDDDDDELVISLCKSASSVSSPASPIFSQCPLCGLSGTPFCASTGKPHNHKKKTRVVRLPKNATGLPDTAKNSDTVVNAGKLEKPKRQKRNHASPDASDPGSSSDVNGKLVAGRGKGKNAQNVSSETGRKRKRQQTIDELTKKPKIDEADNDDDEEPSLADIMRQNMRSEKKTRKALPPPPPPPPFWRPPLDAKESNRAGVVLQRILRAKSSLQVPFMNLLHLPMVPIRSHPVKGEKKKTTASPKKKIGNKKSDTVVGEGEKVEDEEDEEDEENDEQQQGRPVDNEKREDGVADTKAGIVSEEENPENKQAMRKERHPLEIIDMASSAASKRYVRFMQMYTSERTKLDLLRKSTSVQPVPRGPKSTRDATQTSAKDNEPTADPSADDLVTEVEE